MLAPTLRRSVLGPGLFPGFRLVPPSAGIGGQDDRTLAALLTSTLTDPAGAALVEKTTMPASRTSSPATAATSAGEGVDLTSIRSAGDVLRSVQPRQVQSSMSTAGPGFCRAIHRV